MKRYIKSAVNPWKTKYEVHWISPDGKDCLLGGSNNELEANQIARNQARQIFESPFETPERKVHFLDTIYIIENGIEYDAMTSETEASIEYLISKLQ